MAGGCEGERPCPLAPCPLPVAERVTGESIQALPWPEPLILSQQTPPQFPPSHLPSKQAKVFTSYCVTPDGDSVVGRHFRFSFPCFS